MRVDPPHKPFSQSNPLKLFLDMVSSPPADNYVTTPKKKPCKVACPRLPVLETIEKASGLTTDREPGTGFV